MHLPCALWTLPLYACRPCAQVQTAGSVMTPFGELNRSAREATHVVAFTPRTRARSDQFNPEAEHALAPRSHQPDAVESDAFSAVASASGCI